MIEHLNLLVRDISPLLQGPSTCLADRIGKKSTVYNANHNAGMQNLLLSSEGNSFLKIATNFDEYLKEIALNRHFDDGSSEEITESIDLAVEIWDNFEKGVNDERLGDFIQNHVLREKLANNSKIRRDAFFGWDEYAKKLEELFEEIISGNI